MDKGEDDNRLKTQRLLRVLYIGMKNDYGDPTRGYSYEHLTILDTLSKMSNCCVSYFPFDEIMRKVGRNQMNTQLLRTVDDYTPDVCFFILFTDEIHKETIRSISEKSGAITLNWFGDDHWRFHTFSRDWAPLFHWTVTTDSEAVEKYRAFGCHNVIKSQWGFNHHLYRKLKIPVEFDVTFVGQAHSTRKEIVKCLHKMGIDVKCWGKGWDTGRLSHNEMVMMYRRSKINLNFAQSSNVFGWKPIVKIFITRQADDTIHLNPPYQIFKNLVSLRRDKRPQIKGRNFEIPGWGGFLLTSYADNLEDYYVPGKEIAIFSDIDELIDKIKYYLTHDDEREIIRVAGQERTLREHTFEKRIQDVFCKIGVFK